jgi:hypothetical protein
MDTNRSLRNQSRLSRRPDIQQRDLNDGCVLYDQEREIAYTLNVTASLFWSYLDGNLSLEEIVAEVSSISKASEDAVLKDLCDAVAFFQENGLLAPNPGGA